MDAVAAIIMRARASEPVLLASGDFENMSAVYEGFANGTNLSAAGVGLSAAIQARSVELSVAHHLHSDIWLVDASCGKTFRTLDASTIHDLYIKDRRINNGQ